MTDILKAAQTEPVRQFSVFLDNKAGRLLDIIHLLADHKIHPMALTTLDTTDSTIMRMVVDDPDAAQSLLLEHAISFSETTLLVVEINAATDLRQVLAFILQAEINVHYTYAFISRPNGKSALAMRLEDSEIAAQILNQNGFKVLSQEDISR